MFRKLISCLPFISFWWFAWAKTTKINIRYIDNATISWFCQAKNIDDDEVGCVRYLSHCRLLIPIIEKKYRFNVSKPTLAMGMYRIIWVMPRVSRSFANECVSVNLRINELAHKRYKKPIECFGILHKQKSTYPTLTCCIHIGSRIPQKKKTIGPEIKCECTKKHTKMTTTTTNWLKQAYTAKDKRKKCSVSKMRIIKICPEKNVSRTNWNEPLFCH